MQFDALTLAAVADELRATIIGGWVQRIVQTGPLSLGLEIYAHRRRWNLVASAHPQFARVHLVGGKLSRGVEHASPLLLLLRKYVLGGRIVAVEQPPLERIVVISIAKEPLSRNSTDHGPDRGDDALPDPLDSDDLELPDDLPDDLLRCDLIIEPMDRRSNIVLVDDNNVVLDCVKRVTRRMSSRMMLPRVVYEQPPAQREKRDPRAATAAGMEALRETGQADLAKALVAAYRGVSPQAAREVVWRALGREQVSLREELPWYTLAARLRGLWSDPWEPTLVSAAGEPTSFAPYRQDRYPESEALPSISAALERFYSARERVTAHQQRRDAVDKQLATARERLDRQRAGLAAELEKATELEQLRWEGEMIFAYLHTLAPRQPQLVVEGRTITLDPLRSPVDEAQRRFKAYDKAKAAISGVPDRLRTAETALAGLDQLRALLALADSYDQIEQIAAEAVEQGYIPPEPKQQGQRKAASARVRPLRVVSSDGIDIFVGRSAGQNVEATFRIGRPDDWWLHVRNIPGAHVIVRCDLAEVPERTLQEAAALAAYFSPLREEAAAEVEICRRSAVRRIPAAPAGLVTYRAERTLRAIPHAPW